MITKITVFTLLLMPIFVKSMEQDSSELSKDLVLTKHALKRMGPRNVSKEAIRKIVMPENEISRELVDGDPVVSYKERGNFRDPLTAIIKEKRNCFVVVTVYKDFNPELEVDTIEIPKNPTLDQIRDLMTRMPMKKIEPLLKNLSVDELLELI